VQIEGEGDRIFRSSIRAKVYRNRKDEGERSIRLANSKKDQGHAKVPGTCQLL